MEQCKIWELYDLEQTIGASLLKTEEYPWMVLAKIGSFIMEMGKGLPPERFERMGEDIWVAKSARIASTALLNGPLIIDEEAEIRHCAYIRGKVIVGKKAVVGNSTELKNAILFNEVQVPHYNYVGDSILGYKAHMGAGAVVSNLKSDRSCVLIKSEGRCQETGLKKVGAMLGDYVEIGCNSVLNPGTVIGKRTTVYPLSMVRGWVPKDSIYKKQDDVVKKAPLAK